MRRTIQDLVILLPRTPFDHAQILPFPIYQSVFEKKTIAKMAPVLVRSPGTSYTPSPRHAPVIKRIEEAAGAVFGASTEQGASQGDGGVALTRVLVELLPWRLGAVRP